MHFDIILGEEHCASSSERDMARWVHIVAVLAMAALLADSQCDARCLASLCQPGGCHHSSRGPNHGPNQTSKGCHSWQSNLAATEASPDLAKIPVAPLLVMTLPLPAWFFISEPGREYSRSLERGSPPGKNSVLRI
jgi:hypothetical protein